MMVLWHVSEAVNRDGILSLGLLPYKQVNAPEQPAGVYAFKATDAESARKLFEVQYAFSGVAYDVWMIETEGLFFELDAAWGGESYFISDGVGPERVSLAASFVAT